jgi:hypothetical protein
MNHSRTMRVAVALCAAVACSAAISAQQPPTVAVAPPAQPLQTVRPWSLVPSQGGTPLPVQGFSVVLVLGDLQGGSTPDNVPPAAKKALADMKDFLPYKSYRLLDAEWILGSSNVVTRLRGIDDQEYALDMTVSGARDGAKGLSVWFQLREAGPATLIAASGEAREKQVAEAVLERARLEKQIEMLRQKLTENHPDVAKTRSDLSAVEKQLADVEAVQRVSRGSVNAMAGAGLGAGIGRGQGVAIAPRASNSIISTSFTMDPGETVVVGTSRLRGGDKALIALLTAVPRGKPGAKE